MPFDDKYFSTHTYANVSLARFSQYWWSNRFYAMLARRYGKRNARLLEIGSGLGHLVAQLEDSFQTHGLDVNYWAVRQSKAAVKQTRLQTASAQELGLLAPRAEQRTVELAYPEPVGVAPPRWHKG